jgi:hypothetical protein
MYVTNEEQNYHSTQYLTLIIYTCITFLSQTYDTSFNL